MPSVAITIRPAHDGFDPVVFPFDKAIGDARGQKAKKRQDFLLPVDKGRESFAQRFWPLLSHLLDPGLQFGLSRFPVGGGIPGA